MYDHWAKKAFDVCIKMEWFWSDTYLKLKKTKLILCWWQPVKAHFSPCVVHFNEGPCDLTFFKDHGRQTRHSKTSPQRQRKTCIFFKQCRNKMFSFFWLNSTWFADRSVQPVSSDSRHANTERRTESKNQRIYQVTRTEEATGRRRGCYAEQQDNHPTHKRRDVDWLTLRNYLIALLSYGLVTQHFRRYLYLILCCKAD